MAIRFNPQTGQFVEVDDYYYGDGDKWLPGGEPYGDRFMDKWSPPTGSLTGERRDYFSPTGEPLSPPSASYKSPTGEPLSPPTSYLSPTGTPLSPPSSYDAYRDRTRSKYATVASLIGK